MSLSLSFIINKIITNKSFKIIEIEKEKKVTRFEMIFEAAAVRESLLASHTLVRLLARVYPIVVDQVALVGKQLAALIARERLLARVYAQVVGEVVLEAKRLEAHFAHEIL